MLINTRKILASISLLITLAGWYSSCFGETVIISYDSEFSPAFPPSGGYPDTTNHRIDDFKFGAAWIYKGDKANYLMFVSGKGYLYNTESLGHIDSVIVSYSGGVSTSAKFGVRFADTIMFERISTGNKTIKGRNQSDTVTNNNAESGGYFQLSTSSANCQIVSIKIVYTQGNTTPPIDDDIIPPVFSSGYPKAEDVDKDKFDLKVKTNEPCTVFYLVTEGETTPTIDGLLASDSTIAVVAGNTEYTATIEDLEPETTYNVYLIAKDTADNVQGTAANLSVTTASATQRTITLRDIESKYYWGEMANIKWTALNFEAASDLDSILIFKGNKKILSYSIDITSGEADILIGKNIAPDKNTYATNYSLKVVSGNVESEQSDNFTIVPSVTIHKLLTDTTTNGISIFKDKIVKVKGLVTGSKPQNSTYNSFTLQDGDSAYCSIFVYYCVDTTVATGDSVFVEGKFNISTANATNGLYRIGSGTTYTSTATKINSGNNLPTPRISTIREAQTKPLMNSLIKIIGTNCDNTKLCFFIGEDTIYYKETLYTGDFNLLNNRKYNISGVLGKGTGGRYEIWPRSEADIYLYSNDTTIANLVIGGRDAMNDDTLIFSNINIRGVSAVANNEKATLSIRVNNNTVAAADWANVEFAPLDSVFVTVTAEDGTTKTYKRIVDCKTLSFSPLANNTFETDDEIYLSWTSHNISQISLILELQNDTIALTESTISANLGEWQFTVPNTMFGEGLIKAISNDVALDSLTVTISDTKAPTDIRRSPANSASDVRTSLYISMVFDEPIVVANDAKLKIGDLEFPLMAVGDTAAKAFANGLSYSTLYSVSLSGAISDLAGNVVVIDDWTFTTKATPQPDLYFSEYAKGSGSNKYYEIYNPCDTAVDLSRYFVTMNNFSSLATLQLSGWLLPNEVLVVANGSATDEIKRKTDVINSNTTKFTGDDLLGLFRKYGTDTVLIDVLGPYGECETATYWAVAGVEKASTKHSLVRNVVVCGTTDWAESAGTDSLDSQWTVFEPTNLSSLGRHGVGHGTEILKMSIGGTTATIDRTEATVSVEVPYGTDLTEMVITCRISQGAQMLINNALASDTLDFSQPVLATIVAGDSIGRKDWTINVTMAPKPSSSNNILTFNFVETTPVNVTIDTANATVDAVVAYNLDSLKLTPVITISEFASVSSTLFRTSYGKRTAKTRWDFDEPQTIEVTAQDLTKKVWNVMVTKEPEPHLTFSPLANNSFETGDTINLSWTSHNIDGFDLVLDIQGSAIQLTDSTISADLGGWQYVVPNSMFGNGLIKAFRNGIALDSLAVTISDTKAPTIVRQSPANNSAGLNNSLYISMVFDEPIVVANDAKLKIGDLEFPLMTVGDTAAKAFVNGLNYSTLCNVGLSYNAICDLSGNAVVINDWTFTTKAAPLPDLYFSEYAKGSGSNKYYEIYNPCDTAVDLSRYFVTMNNFSSLATLQLSGWLLPNEVLVVANGSATNEIKRKTDVINSNTTKFTGDDLLGLFRKDGTDTVLIDVLGPYGECETATYWAVAGVEKASTDHTLVRNVVVCGTTDWTESAGTDSLDSQWTVLDKDDWTNLGRHGIGHGTEILKMSIGDVAATIDRTKASVSVEVPYGTNLTKMAVTRRISQGSQMFINDFIAKDTVDFSFPVVATVIAGDSVNRKDWTVSVNVGPRPSSDKNILTFSFVETTPVSVTIDTANAIINAKVAFNLDSLKLTPVITISDKAKVSSTLFRTSKGVYTAKTRWDFDEQQNIKVTAQDLTVKNWTVNVEKEPEPYLTFVSLANNSFETGDTIRLSWTSHNISQIVLNLELQNDTIYLADSDISADLGRWQFVVPNSMFGEGWIKAISNEVALDSVAVSITDTKAPAIVRQSPANGSSEVKTSLYISMVFDEPTVVANDAKLKISDLEFPIIAMGDTAAKAFVNGLNYSTLHNVSLSDGAISDFAGNAVTINDWTFTTKAAPQPDLYFSEYAKGSGSNKYYEIYNPCDTAVDLSRYFVTMDNFTSSSRSQVTLQLSGWLLPDEVLVVANGGAAEEIKKRTDVSTSKTTGFTGDDLLGLFRKDGADTVLIDVLGPYGEYETATYWAVAGIEKASTDHSLVRNVVVCGTTDWTESAGTDSLDSQWTVLGKDIWSSLGRHDIGHGTEILKMNIGGAAATIDGTEATVSIEVPYGTDLTEMSVACKISQGAQMFINDSIAGDTIDFSQPVVATIVAGDGIGRKDWTINVTMAPKPSSNNNILSFSFVETTPVNVTIDTANATINAIVAYNLDSLKLTPVITVSEFASVSSTLFRTNYGKRTAKTRWNFDELQTIEVMAQDLTKKVWNVNVTKEPGPHLTFSPLAGISFETGDTIRLSWTSHNIDGIDLALEIQSSEIQLTDSTISADLGGWQYVVPNAMFGNGLVKAVRNDIVLDSLAISIADTKAPTIVKQSPTNGSEGVNNSLYISMAFNEPIVVANDAKLKIGDLEFPITAVGDTAAKAFVNELNYSTLYNISLSDGAICDFAGNAVTINNWAFTTKAAPLPDLYFSEYSKGSSKYYEIYNPCDTAVDLSRYFVTMDEFKTSGRNQATLQLSGWLMSNEVLVVAYSSAPAEVKRMADISTTKTTNFTGDDLLGLFRKNGDENVLIDVLGPFGNCDVAANWAVAGIENASANNTIVRNVVICGTINWSESAGTDSLDSQWTVLGKDVWTSLGRHGIGHGTEILKMNIGDAAATINSTEATVSVEVPYGTDLTKLSVTRRISQGAQIFINDSLAKDTIDFSQPVAATVIAGDSVNRKDWTISVNVAPKPSSEKNILTFKFVETTPVSVTIDTANAIINAKVAFNLDSLKFTPVITISDKAKVSSALFRSSKGIFTAKTRWNFDVPQNIEVTAQDLTVKTWTVNVEKEPEPHLTFSPLANNSFEPGDTIRLSWTSHNINVIDLALDIQNNTIQLTDSAISANLGTWQFVVPDAMFGNGLINAVRNGVVLDSLAVSIADTKAPTIVRQSPANESEGVNNSLYINMVFDEPIVVANDAKLKIGEFEFSLIAVGDTAAKSFVSGLNYSTLYSISLPDGAICDLAGNSVTINDWTFTTKAAPQPDLYFSEYAKGSGSNKYYEIYNPCDTAVDLSCYFVTMDNFGSNGARSQATLQLSGWLLPDEVLVVANSSAAAEIKQMADISTSKTTSFTGDDLLGLFRKDGTDTVLIDILGPYGECETATYWAVAGVEKASTEHTIVRNVVVCGTTDWAESAGTDSLDSQWIVLGKDIWTNLGRHGIGHGTEILKMSIGGVAATIDRTNATVSVEVPYGTDLTEMAVAGRISQGAQMLINNVLAPDTLDFSQPVVATIVAGDSIGRKDWTINVTMAPKPSADNNILTFNFVETMPVCVTIDTANATIDAVVAYNLDSLKLTPVITISEFASVSSTLFRSSYGKRTAKTRWNFDEPQTIEVTAQDLTKKVWNVNVSRELAQALTIKDIAKLDGGLLANAGKPVITEGIVIHIVTTTKGTELYIQDSAGMWSGILVVDEGNLYAATLAVGDRIKVSGIVEENFGMARIGQIETLTVLNSDIKVQGDTIIVEDARSVAYQNALVTIDSVVCTGGFDNLFTVQDSTNSIIVYNKYKFSNFALEIDSMYRITGIVYYTSADGSYRLIPRSADDIVKLVCPAKPVIEPKPETPKPDPPQPQEPDTTTVSVIGTTAIGLTAYTANHTIVIENATSAVSVFDIAGRLIATARPSPRIVINAPYTGIYIVRTRQNAIKVAVE